VTFTDAATKELRDAVRTRLAEALEIFELSEADRAKSKISDEYLQLLNKGLNQAESINRLQRAKLSIDEAAIFTIHGFCQRALSENAFEASLPFESELLMDDGELMQNLVDDFWRRRFAKAPKSLIFKLQQKRITPDSLLKDIRNAVGKPYLEILGPDSEELKAEKWAELEDFFQQAITTWSENEDDLRALLNQPELNEKGYSATFKNSRDSFLKDISLIASSKKLPNKLDSKLVWLGTKEKTLAKFESLEHPFFEQWQAFLDLWTELDSSADNAINTIRIELLQYLQSKLPKEKQRLGVLSFDDLLLQLESALQNQPQLATDLRQKYRVAMIDEFQDTDPIQYNIFNSIFLSSSAQNANDANAKDNTVFFVGDPKQAIYSFRGGDIHTYLKAKNDASQQYTLDKNWRSHPDLISAFNALYKSSDNPFMDTGIQYQAVSAGDRVTDKLITPDERSPLSFWNYVPSEMREEDKPKIDDIRGDIANAVAGDIAALLNASNKGKAMIGDTPIMGGDIAILIRSHSQGDMIKRALNNRGIASVQSSKDSIT
jgi:exodeoxyribonuclease V beta subunit